MKPLSLWQSAAFQYANPKAWMLVAATTTGSFMARERRWQRHTYCHRVLDRRDGRVITWAWVGAALRRGLAVGSRMRTFSITTGVLLAATALWLAMQ